MSMRSSRITFRGTLSLVQVWNETRDLATEITPVYNARKRDITAAWYTRGMTVDWAWDSFESGPGITRVAPSTRGLNICPAGQQLDTDGSTCVNKPRGSYD